MTTGISKTTPMPTMNSVTNERYSDARSWLSITSLAKLIEELERVRQQDEVAEEHPTDERGEHERAERERETGARSGAARIDVRVDLVEDDRHREARSR
jgi:hypothetical protein